MEYQFETSVQFLKGVGPQLGARLKGIGVSTLEDLLHYVPRAYENWQKIEVIADIDRSLSPSSSRSVSNDGAGRTPRMEGATSLGGTTILEGTGGEASASSRSERSVLAPAPLPVAPIPVAPIPVSSVIIKANLLSVGSFRRGPQRQFELHFEDANKQRFKARFFRQPYRGYFEKFQCPKTLWVIGKPHRFKNQWEFHHPELRESIDDEKKTNYHELVPIYPETAGLSSKAIHKLALQAFEKLKTPELWQSKDYLPEGLRKAFNLVGLEEALRSLHCPEAGMEALYFERKTPAQRRLIFEEFFWMELTIALRKNSFIAEKAFSLKADGKHLQKLKSLLPFKLTSSQETAIEEINKELEREYPMNRLLQGDVGSGKTIVIFFAIVQAYAAGRQAALMAPTEILAEQHFLSARKLLSDLGLRLTLLTSRTKKEERQLVLEQLAQGELDFIIGTHALLEEEVQFKHLGLVVIDEQHRFGVEQRRKLQGKGLSPHRLLVTATPIPRTLALTAFGDLEVSVLREKPAGRTPITSRMMEEWQRSLMMEFLTKQIQQGRQAYFVYPLVSESEKLDLKSATEAYEKMKAENPSISWGLLHGKLKPQEKEQIMEAFRSGRIQVLVSTTVIEVGVDVPNAAIMVIEHAERFGLSQLHQLRGRVGRGSQKSYCIFGVGPKVSAEAKQRLNLMCETEDGFKIAEADLQWRGPGEFLGAKQSGLSGFRWADLVKDEAILMEAKTAVAGLLEGDPQLSSPKNRTVRARWERLPWIHTS